MPLPLRRRVAGIEALHAQFEEMEEAHHEQLRLIEQSFIEKSNVLFARRQRIISGLEEPTEEEVSSSAYFAEFEEVMAEIGKPDIEVRNPDVVGVPAFWPTVLRHCSSLQEDAVEGFAVSDADWAVLEHLIEVRTEPWEPEESLPDGFGESELDADEPGFAMHFVFASNPLLRSEELVLYCMGSGEVARATVPEWADPKHDPTVTWRTKKVRKKGAAHSEKRASARPVESFFRIFADAGFDDADDGMNEALLPLGDLQQELVLRLREDAIPRAAMYYISALHGFESDMDEDDFGLDGEEWADQRRDGKRRGL